MHYIYLLCFWFWMIYIFGSIKITVYYTFYLFICSIICNEITVAIYCQKHVLLIIEPYQQYLVLSVVCYYLFTSYTLFSHQNKSCHTLTSFLLIRSEKLINIHSDKIGGKNFFQELLCCVKLMLCQLKYTILNEVGQVPFYLVQLYHSIGQ